MLTRILSCSLLLLSAAPLWAADLAELRVTPPDVNLATALDRQGIVVQAVFTDGITRDVTDQATWTLANPTLVRREGNTLHPVADGTTELKIEFNGQAKTLPVKVDQAAVTRPISFKLDVMPVFMKAGCNTGSCHGAARGKDGFRLSLFGYDANGDHTRITREFPGRRVDLAVPEASMLVEKSVGDVPHYRWQAIREGQRTQSTADQVDRRWHPARPREHPDLYKNYDLPTERRTRWPWR